MKKITNNQFQKFKLQAPSPKTQSLIIFHLKNLDEYP
jgi:hypothetical protein